MTRPVKNANKPHGKLRRSQMITTFGPGAMLDLPRHSVLVAGLDTWSYSEDEQVREPRLIDKLKKVLGVPHLHLKPPPADLDDPTLPPSGVGAWQFPEWFVTGVVPSSQGPSVRSRMLVHRIPLQGKSYIEYKDGSKSKRLPVVPIRFVRACPRGHIGELDWRFFAHRGSSTCKRQLWIDEIGTSADLSELFIRCECDADARCMSDAAAKDMHALGKCDGKQLWLGPGKHEECKEWNRLLIRTASNSYFPQLLSVISLPEKDEELVRAVDHAWTAYLQYVESIEDVAAERKKKPPVKGALQGYSDEQVMVEVTRRKGGDDLSAKSVKLVEFETLSAAKDEIGDDRPEGDFYARTYPKSKWNYPWMEKIARVVLVHRLREVIALAGFTRFEAATPDVTGELDINVRRAPLATDVTWLPAVENKGEGIFIQFDKDAVDKWYDKPQVRAREKSLREGFNAWLQEHPGSTRGFPDIRYLLLHSFSHLLITAVSLECGYPSSSIRERVYALPDTGYGVLLFTGTSDAEGTLGGLVEVGRRIHQHVRTALKMGELCSNDPVCAEHEPKDEHERRFLHGAACHGCLLIGETSCEQHNDFLDRSLIVSTVEHSNMEFFSIDGIG